MARAAAKRRQPTHHHRDDRRHKDSGGQRFEDTLFFSRLRKRAKWVFIFLAVVFAGGFVLFGVGSSNVSGLSDIFNGIGGGGSGQPSVSKAEKATQKNPKDAAAWKTLAAAYDTTGDIPSAISAWTTYTTLRPKDVDGPPVAGDRLRAAVLDADPGGGRRTGRGPEHPGRRSSGRPRPHRSAGR